MLTKPQGFKVSFEGNEETTEMVIFERENITDMPELSKDVPLKDRLINVLSRGALSVKDAAQEMGLTEKDEASLKTVLNRYRNRYFSRLVDGSWGLFKNES